MSKLRLGSTLSLPADTVTSTLVVYGGKGMGKTNCLAVLCEELSASRHRFVALDPLGVLWGLRHSKNGKGRGIEVLILGGKHGDMPIEPTAGAVVADLVADEDVDVVVDISRRPDGTMWTVGERIKFITDFCTRVYARQGERARPRMLLIDEAGRYVPQEIPHGNPQITACLHSIEVIVEEGRNVALGVCLVTQRSARMKKSVSELADCMIAFRTVGPRSIDAVVDWFGEHVPKSRWKELVEQLRALPRGTALVVSPGWLAFEGTAAVRERTTFDSSATPGAGKERRATGPGAKPDLDRYKERMAATIEKAKQDDPKELRRAIQERDKRIRELVSAKTATIAVATPGKDVVRRVEVPMLSGPQLTRFEKACHALETAASKMDEARGPVAAIAAELLASVRAARARADALVVSLDGAVEKVGTHWDTSIVDSPRLTKLDRLAAATWTTNLDTPLRRVPAPKPGAEERRQPVQARILDALGELAALGVEKPKRAFVAALCGYGNVKTQTFARVIATMQREGLIDCSTPGTVQLTPKGADMEVSPDQPRTSAELQARLVAVLGSPTDKIVALLIREHPNAISRVALAEACGYGNIKTQTFAEAIARLKDMGFIDTSTPGTVAAKPWLMLEGR